MPFPQPPKELPEKWGCEIVELEFGNTCPAVIKYCYEVHRTFIERFKIRTVKGYKICLPYKREEIDDYPSP